jgi:HEAT repeat protein
MKAASCVSLAVALTLATADRSAAQDEKPPDYSRKPASEWLKALQDPQDADLAGEARQALGPAGPYTKTAIPLLIDALDETPDPSLIVATLADYGPPVVPSLVRALASSKGRVRAWAADTLGAVRPRPTDAVPALIGATKDSDLLVRASAAHSLGAIRRPFDKTVPALAALLKDSSPRVRKAAVQALSRMGRAAGPAAPALLAALKDGDRDVRAEADWALWQIAPAAKDAVPGLIEALRGAKDTYERGRLMQLLGRIGPAAKDVVPALVEALQEQDDSTRSNAAFALGGIGPEARAAVPELLKLAKDRNNQLCVLAITALGKIGPDAKAAVPTLLEALEYGRSRKGLRDFQYGAAQALGGIGPDARAALPALITLARDLDADSSLRETAAHAVIKIDPELAAKEKMELAYLNVRLGKVPSVKLESRAAVMDERRKCIKALIAKLAEIKDPDFGMSATLTGDALAPVSGQERAGMMVLTDHGIKTSDAFRSLVAMGPEALPYLLSALEDKTPTRLKAGLSFATTFIGGSDVTGNPLNSSERRIVSREAVQDDNDDEAGMLQGPYTLKVGDVCFVAIGQIVGRPYRAASYIPSAMVSINSPVATKDLRDRVRAIWSSDDPARKLLDSLLIDYATEGLYNGKSFDTWHEGSDRQIQAALRLLYYFPKETAPLIAGRLRSFDVRQYPDDDGAAKRDVKNGVSTRDFIQAVAWCEAPEIREALADLAKRTDDPDIKEVLSSSKK